MLPASGWAFLRDCAAFSGRLRPGCGCLPGRTLKITDAEAGPKLSSANRPIAARNARPYPPPRRALHRLHLRPVRPGEQRRYATVRRRAGDRGPASADRRDWWIGQSLRGLLRRSARAGDGSSRHERQEARALRGAVHRRRESRGRQRRIFRATQPTDRRSDTVGCTVDAQDPLGHLGGGGQDLRLSVLQATVRAISSTGDTMAGVPGQPSRRMGAAHRGWLCRRWWRARPRLCCRQRCRAWSCAVFCRSGSWAVRR